MKIKESDRFHIVSSFLGITKPEPHSPFATFIQTAKDGHNLADKFRDGSYTTTTNGLSFYLPKKAPPPNHYLILRKELAP